MSHARLLYYALVAVVGLMALAISSIAVVRSRVPAYWYMIGFYAGFTAMVCTIFAREYLYMNVEDFSLLDVFRTYAAGSVVEPLYLASLALFLHRLSAVTRMTLRDVAVAATAIMAGVIGFYPGAVTLDLTNFQLIMGLPIRVGNALYLLILAYVLFLTVTAIRRDRSPRELILIIVLLLFGMTGFTESVIGFTNRHAVTIIEVGSGATSLLVSTVPYLVFGVVLIYYFGAYLLAESRPSSSLDITFVERFGISPREAEVIDLMNRGMSNREIAEKLYVSLATVKSHAHNIYEKTGAGGRYDLYHLTTH